MGTLEGVLEGEMVGLNVGGVGDNVSPINALHEHIILLVTSHPIIILEMTSFPADASLSEKLHDEQVSTVEYGSIQSSHRAPTDPSLVDPLHHLPFAGYAELAPDNKCSNVVSASFTNEYSPLKYF